MRKILAEGFHKIELRYIHWSSLKCWMLESTCGKINSLKMMKLYFPDTVYSNHGVFIYFQRNKEKYMGIYFLHFFCCCCCCIVC